LEIAESGQPIASGIVLLMKNSNPYRYIVNKVLKSKKIIEKSTMAYFLAFC
jgi:hypothetical protein